MKECSVESNVVTKRPLVPEHVLFSRPKNTSQNLDKSRVLWTGESHVYVTYNSKIKSDKTF